MNAVRIARAGREDIDDEQMNALVEQVRRFFDERSNCASGGFIARRDDLDHRGDLVAADVPDGDRHLLAAIESQVGFSRHRKLRLGDEEVSVLGVRSPQILVAGMRSYGGRNRTNPPDVLLWQRVIMLWKNALVQAARYLKDPRKVKCVKNAGIESLPIVNRHGSISELLRIICGLVGCCERKILLHRTRQRIRIFTRIVWRRAKHFISALRRESHHELVWLCPVCKRCPTSRESDAGDEQAGEEGADNYASEDRGVEDRPHVLGDGVVRSSGILQRF